MKYSMNTYVYYKDAPPWFSRLQQAYVLSHSIPNANCKALLLIGCLLFLTHLMTSSTKLVELVKKNVLATYCNWESLITKWENIPYYIPRINFTNNYTNKNNENHYKPPDKFDHASKKAAFFFINFYYSTF